MHNRTVEVDRLLGGGIKLAYHDGRAIILFIDTSDTLRSADM